MVKSQNALFLILIMSIPNVSTLYQRIKSGSEGGLEFSRCMNYLLTAEAKEEGWNIEPYSDASGDYAGLDALVEGGIVEGYHFKFYPSPLSDTHKVGIKKAINSAISKSPGNMISLNIITPEDLMKEDKIWFEEIKSQCKKTPRQHQGAYFMGGIKLSHWGHTKIVELALRHPHIGKHYFPELFSYDTDLFKMVNLKVDEQNFIFDFSFTNDSQNTYLLNKIQLIRLETWSSMGSLGEEHYLKSLGKLMFKVNMKKATNELVFSDPIIFKSKTPMRFKIQLLDFVQTCPGNGVKIKFRFLFNDGVFMESKPILLNL